MHASGRFFLPFLGVAVCGLALLASGNLLAQPGTEADPVVSLSYLEAALGTDPVVLEGGEELPIPPGRGVALIEGRCRLSPPAGGSWWVLDVSSGEVLAAQIEMVRGHWYVPIAAEGLTGRFQVQAWQTSTVAVPAGAGAN
jgi:hypothetical protein